MKLRYSGKSKESIAFWERINAVKGTNGKLLYALGCDLQDIEGEMLRFLEEAEADPKNNRALRKKLEKARTVKRR